MFAVFYKVMPPWLALSMLVSVGAGVVSGKVLLGGVSGSVPVAASQAVLIDHTQFDIEDISDHASRRFVAVSDDRTSFTAAAEIATGDEVTVDVPLINTSENEAIVELTLEYPPEIYAIADPFWTSLSFTRSLSAGTLTRTFSTPSPAPFTGTLEQSRDHTLELNSTAGLGTTATVSPQTSNALPINVSPSGAPAVSAQNSDAALDTVTPAGSPASIGPQSAVGLPVGPPAGAPPVSLSGIWYEGTLSVDWDGDNTLETVYFLLTDTTFPGVYDTVDLSLDDSTYGQGLLSDMLLAVAGDDARFSIPPAPPTPWPWFPALPVSVTLGSGYVFDLTFAVPSLSITSASWYKGSFSVDWDGDSVLETLYYVMSDTDSNGLYETIDLSLENETYGEGVADATLGSAGDDGRIGAAVPPSGTADILLGSSYTFSLTYFTNPLSASPDASITSKTWFVGTLVLDANGDGDKTDPTDTLNYVLTDTDSDALYDRVDLSLDDSTFAEGNLTNLVAATSGNDDERVLHTEVPRELDLERYRFSTTFARNPAGTTSDVSITSRTWFSSGGFTTHFLIDAEGNGTADDKVAWLISDTDSDGLYDKIDLSMDDTLFGDGATGDGRVGLTQDNDERADLNAQLVFGDSTNSAAPYFRISRLDGSPVGDADPALDVGIFSPWYVGVFEIDIDGDQVAETLDLVLIDPGVSEGIFTRLNMDRNDSGAYTADEVHQSGDLIMLGGMKIEVTFPTTGLSVTYTQGKVITVVQTGAKTWLIRLPAPADTGHTQDNVRIKVVTPDDVPPGYYTVKGTFKQRRV